MAPRPLTSIFMAPPPPSRLTASGGAIPAPQVNGSGPTTPTYNSAFPGLPVTSLPEGGISIFVPTTAEPESEPEPVWVPKARQGLGTGAVGKSSVWDVIGGAPAAAPAPSGTKTPPSNSRPGSRKPTLRNPQNQNQRSATVGSGTTEQTEDAPPRKRHVPRNPLDPHRLALISNALGVSMPLPARSVIETKLQSRALADRGRQASLDDARLVQNHARHASLASFNSASAAHLRNAPSLSVTSRRQLAASPSFVTPSQPTRFLLHVYPPPHMPSVHPFASRSPPPGYHSQFRRGTLVPLHATLSGQLSAVAKEYGLPGTNGMFVYLLSADFEPTETEDDDEYAVQAQRDDRSMGPRIGEEAWKMLWAALLRADREEFMRPYNPNDGGDGGAMGSPASGVAALMGEDSPLQKTISPKSSQSSFAPKPLRTVAAMNSREGFKPASTPTQGQTQTPLSVSSPSSLATHSRSNTSSPTTLSTTTATTVSIMPALPIVGKIEFDIDMRRAPWYAAFCAKAEQRRLPSRVNTPIGPLATPAPAGGRSTEQGAPSPIVLSLPPPRARSVSPGLGEEAGRPVSPKFPIRLQLPSNPANARGLLSPRDAMMTPTSPAGSSSGWPSEESPETETAGMGGLGLDLSPSSSTVADGAVEGVVAEGYAQLGEDESGDAMSFSFHPPSDSGDDAVSRGDTSMLSANDPLGDVFPDEPWNASTRAVMGIDDLPPTRNEEIDDESGELPPIDAEAEVRDVTRLWEERNRPTLTPGGEPMPVVKPTGPSPVVFPRPAPSRQRSDSLKRPPPLKLAAGSSDAIAEPWTGDADKLAAEEPVSRQSGDGASIVVTGEDGQEDWTWRSSEHVRKERLDELEKALAQLSPRILEPPPDFDRPRSPGLHHRILGSPRRPDPHAPLFMSEELSNLRASMAAKGNSSPTGSASSPQASPSWPAVPFAQSNSSVPRSPRFPETPHDLEFLDIPSSSTPMPMSSELRIRMQTEQMRLDLANLPPPGTAPPRPRRPQTPVALNSPPTEDSPPVPGHQRSRFSIDSTGDDIPGLPSSAPERSNSIMSVKGIRKLWRGRNSTQNLNGKNEVPPPVPSGNPQMLGYNRDSQLHQAGPAAPNQPGHTRQSSQAQPAQVAAVKSTVAHKRDSSNSGKDPFHFDQDSRNSARSASPSYPSDSTATGSIASAAKTKSILKKWSSKAKRAEGEPESAPGTRPQSRQQNPLSPPRRPLNGLGGPERTARGSVSSVNTLTTSNSGALQADMPSRPSVSSSMVSDAEPMTPRMSQFEMVSPPPGQSPS
ncbi:hypothetical protein FRC06_011708 [Ceratobasidium sp. 370]|nr:hypothetical protein FRC06_011708 [Ceratobasidium sp. 370]